MTQICPIVFVKMLKVLIHYLLFVMGWRLLPGVACPVHASRKLMLQEETLRQCGRISGLAAICWMGPGWWLPYMHGASPSWSSWVGVKHCSEPSDNHKWKLYCSKHFLWMSPTPNVGKYIKSATYCTIIPTPWLMCCTHASRAFSPAWQMHFRGSSCICPMPLCRCSPGHTWRSPGGSKDSSLKGTGEGQDELWVITLIWPLPPAPLSRK